jgi:hypothetical protein
MGHHLIIWQKYSILLTLCKVCFNYKRLQLFKVRSFQYLTKLVSIPFVSLWLFKKHS